MREYFVSHRFESPESQAVSLLMTRLEYSKHRFVDMHPFAEDWTGWDGNLINRRDRTPTGF
jgi:hypothetical protein